MRADDNDRRVPLSAIARRYQHFLLDLDGCLWVGDEPTERAGEALDGAARRPARASSSSPTRSGSSPEEIVRKLWRLGFQASLDEVMTAGAALQFTLAAHRSGGGAAFVIGSQALVDHVAEAGLRIVNNTEFATRADIVVVADHDRFDYGELRIATQAAAARRRADRPQPRPHVPDARRPVAGQRRGARRGRDRRRAQGGHDRRQARAGHVRGRPRPPRRGPHPRRSATASTPTCWAPSAPGSTPRSC